MSSLNRVFLDLINQIFILNIHHCFERSYLRYIILSCFSISEVIIRFFEIMFFLFMVFCWGQEILNCSTEYLHCSWMMRVIMYSIDSSNSFWFTKTLGHCFRTLFIYRLMPIRSIKCDDKFFDCEDSLSFHMI